MNNLHAARVMIEDGVDVDNALFDALIVFKTKGENSDILKLILEKVSDCNKPTLGYGVPLLYALHYASLECIKLLLDHGADITAVDGTGATVLHWAVQNPKVEVLQYLLDLGCDIESTDNYGWSALHQAVSLSEFAACELLLKNGANVNKCDDIGRSPLILAIVYVYKCPEAMMRLLLEHGANVTNNQYDTSTLNLLVATSWCDRDIAKLFIAQIAKMASQHCSINESDREIIENDDYYREYYRECLQEFENMRVTKFYNSVSVFDIFMKSDKVTFGYVRNEELVKSLENEHYDQHFPIYFMSLSKEFYSKVEKQRLHRTAAETLGDLFKFNDSLHIVNQKILSYMQEKDLKFLTI